MTDNRKMALSDQKLKDAMQSLLPFDLAQGKSK